MNSSASPKSRRAPGWLGPLLVVLLVVAVIWTLGVTLFRPVLDNRGLPEEIRGASEEQFEQWEYGAYLADLSQRAEDIRAQAEDEPQRALAGLNEALRDSAALLGQVHYAEPVAAPSELANGYSTESVIALVNDVITASQAAPLTAVQDPGSRELLIRVAFQVNLAARELLESIAEPAEVAALGLPTPADETDTSTQDTEEIPVACLADANLLSMNTGIPEDADTAAVLTARALDRGYALDYVLQLQAARSGPEASSSIEVQRKVLAQQLAQLRQAVDSECADLRQAAYNLPEAGMKNLEELSQGLEQDFLDSLLKAGTVTEGAAQQVIGATAWDVLLFLQSNDVEPELLSATS